MLLKFSHFRVLKEQFLPFFGILFMSCNMLKVKVSLCLTKDHTKKIYPLLN